MKKKLLSILCLIAMTVLIIDARHAITGAKDGIELCLYTVIPALFPYCILSLIFQKLIQNTEVKLLRPFEKFCRMPKGSGIVLLLGLLGGYPTGAILADRTDLDRQSKSNMTIFCNNSGPSFIFGIVSIIFNDFYVLLVIWIIQILSAIITAIILNTKKGFRNSTVTETNNKAKTIQTAIRAMCNISATIILFRVIIACLEPLVLKNVPLYIKTVLVGILELTNGITYLKHIDHDAIKFVLCCGMLSFGGICVAMQTVSVSNSIKIGKYISGKLLQALISMLIAVVVVFHAYWLLIIPIFMLLIINMASKHKKRGSFFLMIAV